MTIDFLSLLADRAREAGVTNLLDVPMNAPAVSDVYARIADWETKTFTTTNLKSVEEVLWNDFNMAINTLNNLQNQIGSIAPRTKSLLKSAMYAQDPAAFPIRTGTLACRDEPYCVNEEAGVPIFTSVDEANLWPPYLTQAFANLAADIIVQAALERRASVPGTETPGTPLPGSPEGPPLPGTPKKSRGMSMLPVAIGGALVGLLLLLKRK